ncbi:hypothetical protein IE53DRAFT_362738 [Violaceomyces palustris]|uniref:Uncharacterized protein n=1 Tax=Violaceomyces palustris TaxID=1673888 RepID=A0ACD0NVY4_9BASI|nr:hypothetical protein IE53DRAFT_362738 [Violaceomyces palustris]
MSSTSSSPRHSPPPSSAAPKPKGILKNAPERLPVSNLGQNEDHHLQWDESNLTLHEIQREQQEARMKIDEPKTPFVRGSSLGPVGDDEVLNFDLDGGVGSLSGTNGSSGILASPSSTGSRRGSSASQTAANTLANRRPSNSGLSPVLGSEAAAFSSKPTLMEASSSQQPRDSEGLREQPIRDGEDSGEYSKPSMRGTSRSPSFSLPKSNSRRSSSRSIGTSDLADSQRQDVRQENDQRIRDAAVGGDADLYDDDGEIEEEEEDPETRAKHAAFAAKRNRHYGNEAEAMKIAAALASQEDDEDEDDDEGEDDDDEANGDGDEEMTSGVPPVPPLLNGKAV